MREKLTKKDVEKIEQEIEHRKLVVRKEAIEAVKEARAAGRLSAPKRPSPAAVRTPPRTAVRRRAPCSSRGGIAGRPCICPGRSPRGRG